MHTVKPLAKSLHTVTVLVRVARLIETRIWESGASASHADAIEQALCALGLDTMPDNYGLAAAALKQLDR